MREALVTAQTAARVYGGVACVCSLCLMLFAWELTQTHAAAAAIVPFSAGLIFAGLSIPVWCGYAWAAIALLATMITLAVLAAVDDARYLWVGAPLSLLFGAICILVLRGSRAR